ncbi:unclassified [Brachyspira pilosicoli WesB]|uniref:Unclassified n=1 Tax=Brachyspira pilosicoli WesB TaxID=1161918 RepID=K0JLL1_BRAPL|nr:unclassified [Brachyspira pilosicoli WesB]
MNIIKKPFRFLKNLMRWYEKESDNNLREIRTEVIENELWKKGKRTLIKEVSIFLCMKTTIKTAL